MNYEVIGETIKSATSIKLGDIFKVATTKDGVTTYTYPTRYKENITKPKYPSFLIWQVSENAEPAGVGTQRMRVDYLMDVQYRLAENTETISNLRTQLDAIGFKLNTSLLELNLGLPVKTKNRRYEIVDGVLHFFYEVTVFVEPNKEIVTQQELELIENIGGNNNDK